MAEALASLGPDLTLANAYVWGIHQQMEDLFLLLSITLCFK